MIPESGNSDEMKAALLSKCARAPQEGEVFQFSDHPQGRYYAEYLYTVDDDGTPKYAFVVRQCSVDTWIGMLVYVRSVNWIALLGGGNIRFAYNIIDDKGIFIESAHRA